MSGKSGRRSFGWVRKLPSKRYQASYVGPDGARHNAPATFTAKLDAEGWLAAEDRLTASGNWTAPEARAAVSAAPVTLAAYSETWLRQRELKPRTRALYRDLLDRQILNALGGLTVDVLTPAAVRAWYSQLDAGKPRQRAHAYALLRTICTTAVHDDLLTANPCRLRGAGQAPARTARTEPATRDELDAIAAAMPERLRLMVLLAAWCALRYGELAELRRSDLDLRKGVVRVRRAVVWVDGAAVVGKPKSDAGVRDVAVPPHVLPAVRDHLATLPMTGKDALLFPSASDPTKPMRAARVFTPYARAREAAGRPDLRFHDLRHTGATLATGTGASLAEVMARLGHSTPTAAMRYQHAARGRDAEIALMLSALANGAGT